MKDKEAIEAKHYRKGNPINQTDYKLALQDLQDGTDKLEYYEQQELYDVFAKLVENHELTQKHNIAIEPKHYRKGEIDLYESWYRTRPFNEFRAIMESVAERYLKRVKVNRLEDLDKAMYTINRLREYEEIEQSNANGV